MKKVLLICTLLFSISAFSQNGGQSAENPSVKMEYSSLNNGIVILKITNKQNCMAEIKTKANSYERIKSYPPLSSDTLILPNLGNFIKVQSRTLTNCGTTDFGNVELNLDITNLPVKFGRISITITKIPK